MAFWRSRGSSVVARYTLSRNSLWTPWLIRLRCRPCWKISVITGIPGPIFQELRGSWRPIRGVGSPARGVVLLFSSLFVVLIENTPVLKTSSVVKPVRCLPFLSQRCLIVKIVRRPFILIGLIRVKILMAPRTWSSPTLTSSFVTLSPWRW